MPGERKEKNNVETQLNSGEKSPETRDQGPWTRVVIGHASGKIRRGGKKGLLPILGSIGIRGLGCTGGGRER